MKGMTRAAVALGLGVAIAFGGSFSLAASAESKTQKIEQLLELTNSGSLGIQAMDGMILQLQQTMPEIPAEWWSRFRARTDVDELTALIVPIYERNFTDAEIDAMIAFYQTPEGQSVIAKMPNVLSQSMMAGQLWGTSIAEDVLRELEADGYDVPDSLAI